MARYWTNFVKSGDPNGEELPRWPTFDSGGNTLHLDNPVVVGSVPGTSPLRVFDAVYDEVRGKPFGRPLR